MIPEWSQGVVYLGLPSSKDIHHDFHHCFMHSKSPHEIGVLVKHFVIHDIPRKNRRDSNKAELRIMGTKAFIWDSDTSLEISFVARNKSVMINIINSNELNQVSTQIVIISPKWHVSYLLLSVIWCALSMYTRNVIVCWVFLILWISSFYVYWSNNQHYATFIWRIFRNSLGCLLFMYLQYLVLPSMVPYIIAMALFSAIFYYISTV